MIATALGWTGDVILWQDNASEVWNIISKNGGDLAAGINYNAWDLFQAAFTMATAMECYGNVMLIQDSAS